MSLTMDQRTRMIREIVDVQLRRQVIDRSFRHPPIIQVQGLKNLDWGLTKELEACSDRHLASLHQSATGPNRYYDSIELERGFCSIAHRTEAA